MIATRNRCDDLRRTAERLQRLHPQPLEVLICADGCTDDTLRMLQNDFPTFTVLVNTQSQGSVPSRDRMLRLAKGDIVVSLDDDSYPTTDDFLAQLKPLIETHQEAAVITFPEQRNGEVFTCKSKTPTAMGHYVSAYPNCAAAMRREFYLRQPGFPAFFIHMYEEPDYALQCYAAGASVWFEPRLVVRHHLSNTQRQPMMRHHQNARNELWSVWMRCPWPQLLVVSTFRIGRQFRYACSEGFWWAIQEPTWWWQALKGYGQCMRLRRPVRWSIYIGWMQLARTAIHLHKDLKKVFPHLTDP